MKRILAIITSLALLLSVVIIPSAFVVNAEETTENEVTVYVATTGSDEAYVDETTTTYGNGTEEHPYLTLSKAMEVIEADETATSGRIIIKDGTTTSTGINFSQSVHTKMITIAGTNATIYLVGSGVDAGTDLKGPTTFETIILYKMGISTNGHKVIFGEGVKHRPGTLRLNGGTVDSEYVYFDNFTRGKDANDYCSIIIGNSAAYEVDGTVNSEVNNKYVVNGDVNVYTNAKGSYNFKANQFQILSGTFNGNVNITVNGKGLSIGSSDTLKIPSSYRPTFNGAVQIVLNNGIARSKVDLASFREKGPAGNTWIISGGESKTDDSILETTATAGVFKVNGNMIANAYKIDVTKVTAEDGTVTYTETKSETAVKSVNGILDLANAPGEYVVTYTTLEAVENEDLTVYVSADGFDDNDGTADAPFATIDFAQKWLNMSTAEGAKEIIVMGTVAFDGGEPHENMITIKGADSTAKLTYVPTQVTNAAGTSMNAVVLQGPTTFDGIYLPSKADCGNVNVYLVSAGHKVVYNNTTIPDGSASRYYYVGQVEDTLEGTRENVTFEVTGGGVWTANNIYIGSASSKKTESAGVDLTVNGGRLREINLAAGTTYSGNVNIVLNDFSKYGTGSNYTAFTNNKPTINGAFQVIVNKGKVAQLASTAIEKMSAVEAAGGTWVINAQTASDGSLLETTDYAGKFAFTSKNGLAAYAYDQEGNLVAQSEDGILDLSEMPGVYTVEYADEAYMLPAIYVDATNGSDEYLGSEDKPVATLKAAIEKVLTTAAEDKVIYIMGTVDTLVNGTSDYVTYSEMITFKAYDENSAINLIGSWKNRVHQAYLLQGPTTLEGLKIIDPRSSDSAGDITEILTNGNELIINDCYSNTAISIAVGDFQKKETTSSINKLTVNGFKVVDDSLNDKTWLGLKISYGSFGGDTDTASAGYSTKGIDITLNGARLRTFSAITKYGGTITGDVNITINKCSTTLGSGNEFNSYVGVYDSETETLTQAQTIKGAVRVVVNNNIGDKIVKGSDENNNLSKITAEGGAYFVYSSDVNGNTMGIGEGAGTFAINSPYSVDVKDADGNVVKRASDVLSVEAGTYYVSFYNAADINADGKLDIRDLVALKNVFAEETVPNYPQYDISLDGKVEASDLSAFQKYFLNVEDIKFGTVENLNFTYFEDVELLSDEDAAEYENEIYRGTTEMPEDTEEIIYVSSFNADGTGDGSEENPYESIEALNAAFADMVKDSDTTQRAVLFERGSVFRTTEALVVDSYTYYGAYGEGDKPQILGSLQDYADASLWTSENGGSIWKLQLELAEGYEAANIVVTKNGVEGIAIAKNELSSVDNTGEYYYDLNTGIVYLYCDYINPAKYFDTIEISTTNILVTNYVRLGDEADTRVANSNFIIDNLSFKYAGKNAMSLVNAKDAQVTYCEIGWIGGHYTDSRADRYGNGIEMWNSAKVITIANNHIYQVYDAAVTYQGEVTNHYEDIAIEANLIQRCSYGFEFWASAGLADDATDEEKMAAYEAQEAHMTGIVFDSNLMQLAAGGMGGACRPTAKYQSFIQPYGFNSSLLPEGSFDVTVSNNIFDTSYRAFIYGVDTTIEAITFEGNTYYQSISTAPCVVRSIVCEDENAFYDAIAAIEEYYNDALWEY